MTPHRMEYQRNSKSIEEGCIFSILLFILGWVIAAAIVTKALGVW